MVKTASRTPPPSHNRVVAKYGLVNPSATGRVLTARLSEHPTYCIQTFAVYQPSYKRGPLDADQATVLHPGTFAVCQSSYKWGPLGAGQGNIPHPWTLAGQSRAYPTDGDLCGLTAIL